MVRALVVDDSRIMRMVIRGHLKKCGLGEADIQEAGNGQEALDKMAREPVDIVLSDVNMPIMDGEQLLTWLAEDGFLSTGKAIMVTSRYERHLFRRLLHTGASTIIRKPFSLEGFQRQLEPVLQDIADRRGEEAPTFDVQEPSAPAASPSVLDDDVTVMSDASDPAGVLQESTVHVLRSAGIQVQPMAVEPLERGSLFLGEIDIHGGGSLSFFADTDASNAIGTHLTHLPPSDDELRADTIGELANIVAGMWQSRLARETPFSTPRTGTLAAREVVWEGLVGLQLHGGGRVYLGLLT